VEYLSPANDADHWDLVEGQGSLFHASFAGVSLGLLHGAQADALTLCHEPTRQHMRGLPGYALPELQACMDRTGAEEMSRFHQLSAGNSGSGPGRAPPIVFAAERIDVNARNTTHTRGSGRGSRGIAKPIAMIEPPRFA
jgi:hypothetical protein